MADKNMKLPSRNYWEGFVARNEALWDKIRNNTFVNMVFPVQEVSEGNTEALLPLVVPEGNAAVQAAKTVTRNIALPRIVTKSGKLGKPAEKMTLSEIKAALSRLSLKAHFTESLKTTNNALDSKFALFLEQLKRGLVPLVVGTNRRLTPDRMFFYVGTTGSPNALEAHSFLQMTVPEGQAALDMFGEPALQTLSGMFYPQSLGELPFKDGGKLNYTKFFK